MGAAKLPEDVDKQAEDRLRQLRPMDSELAAIMAAEKVPMKFEPRSKPLRAIGSALDNLKSIFKVRNQRDEIWILVTAIEEVAKKLTDSTATMRIGQKQSNRSNMRAQAIANHVI